MIYICVKANGDINYFTPKLEDAICLNKWDYSQTSSSEYHTATGFTPDWQKVRKNNINESKTNN